MNKKIIIKKEVQVCSTFTIPLWIPNKHNIKNCVICETVLHKDYDKRNYKNVEPKPIEKSLSECLALNLDNGDIVYAHNNCYYDLEIL